MCLNFWPSGRGIEREVYNTRLQQAREKQATLKMKKMFVKLPCHGNLRESNVQSPMSVLGFSGNIERRLWSAEGTPEGSQG